MSERPDCERVFILGAGFSKAAGLPLATELTDLLIKDAMYPDDDEKQQWLSAFIERLKWVKGDDASPVNIEELFHFAALEVERWKMQQQLCSVGRECGPGTPYNFAETIEYSMRMLLESLPRVIWSQQQGDKCDLTPILRFARTLRTSDVVVTFNYDTLVERALDQCGMAWNHSLKDAEESPDSVAILKLHGSIDWMLLKRDTGNAAKLSHLFSKTDTNVEEHGSEPPDEPEYQSELWRINEAQDVGAEIERRGGSSTYISFPGMTALGDHKPLANLPGSAQIWCAAERALYSAEEMYVVGFSLAPFDAMTRLLFGAVMKERHNKGKLPNVLRLIDPAADSLLQNYMSVFRMPILVDKAYSQDIDWHAILG